MTKDVCVSTVLVILLRNMLFILAIAASSITHFVSARVGTVAADPSTQSRASNSLRLNPKGIA
jgi:hypothetical protein